MKYKITTLLATSAAAALLCAGAAWADDQAAPAAAPPAAPASWVSGIKLKAQVEVGVTANPDQPPAGINWGHAFTDRSNEVLLNGVSFTAERDPDTSSKTIDVGFKVQASYGSDARYTQLIGEFNRSINSINQFDLVEANVQAHLPYITAGGMEVKLGQYGTLEGEEVMDPSGNFFYSHSYLFNYGIPLKHTGLMTETHLNPKVDLYLGVDSGVNTFLGSSGGANDNVLHFHGGIGLNLTNLTILATTHIGPEAFTSNGSYPTKAPGNRYLNDIVVTWTVNKSLTAIIDANYTKDDAAKVSAGGVVGYLEYALSPDLSVGLRAEVWADSDNFFVAGYPNHYDFINYEGGYGTYNPAFASKGTTYGELTLGVNYKPQGLPKVFDGMVIRPELRFDDALSGGTPYDVHYDAVSGTYYGTKKSQFTFGLDIVAPIHL
ncbi:MAG: outer membrane beta-barrel protein [Caulobacteraceae bacterium]|nr:outer membrane beta-barrel protein [Caulobacteraceae bacterium]